MYNLIIQKLATRLSAITNTPAFARQLSTLPNVHNRMRAQRQVFDSILSQQQTRNHSTFAHNNNNNNILRFGNNNQHIHNQALGLSTSRKSSQYINPRYITNNRKPFSTTTEPPVAPQQASTTIPQQSAEAAAQKAITPASTTTTTAAAAAAAATTTEATVSNTRSIAGRIFDGFCRIFVYTTLFGGGGLILLDYFINPHRINHWIIEFYRNYYIPKSPYKDLYTYSTSEYFQKDLTFQITEEPSNDIPAYQLLLHKDFYCLSLYCEELLAQLQNILDRQIYYDEKGNIDTEAHQETSEFLRDITYFLRDISQDLLAYEILSNRVFDWENYHTLEAGSPEKVALEKEYRKYQNQLEAAWCHTTGYRIGCEHLLPLLEKLSTRLLYTKAIYDQKVQSHEFQTQLQTAQRLGLDADVRYPLREYTELPGREIAVILANTKSEIEKLTKHYITKPMDLRTSSMQNNAEVRKRLGTLRSSRKPRYLPQKFRNFVEKSRELRKKYIEQLELAEKNLEQEKEQQTRLLQKREDQIKERFEYLKRRDKIEQSFARVLGKMEESKLQIENPDDVQPSSSQPRPLTTLPDVDNLTQEHIADLIRQAEDSGVPQADIVELQQLLAKQESSKALLSNSGVQVKQDIDKNTNTTGNTTTTTTSKPANTIEDKKAKMMQSIEQTPSMGKRRAKRDDI